MGNRLVCCRLSWTSFTNPDESIVPESAYQSRYQFTNHAAFFPPIIASTQPHTAPSDENYEYLLSFCSKVTAPHITDMSVQHISEREPEDFEFNPSLNANNSTLFIHRILRSISRSSPLQKMLYLAKVEIEKQPPRGLQKWSSCSSVYISDGCLSKPDSKLILHCVSVALCSLIKSERQQFQSTFTHLALTDQDLLIDFRSDQSPSLTSTYNAENECSIGHVIYEEVYEIYDERVYPLFPLSSYCQVDSHFSPHEISCIGLRFQHQILCFINRLFSSSLLTAESAIVALVYLERLISGLDMHIVSWSWRRQLLACILIASKVLDDQAVWNADYCQLLKDVHVDDLNSLERHTLSLLQFNTGVPPAVYARYYFDLITLGELVALPTASMDLNEVSALRRCRRRLTPRLARRLHLLPLSAEARSEQLASAGLGGGGGQMFDLPCSAMDHAETDSGAQQGRKQEGGSGRRRAHSTCIPLSSIKVRGSFSKFSTRHQGTHNYHQHDSQIKGTTERVGELATRFAPPCSDSRHSSTLSTSATSRTSSSSSSSTSNSIAWKSSSSEVGVGASTSSSERFQHSAAAVAATNIAFDAWGTTPSSSTMGAFRFSGGVAAVDSRSIERAEVDAGESVNSASANALFLLKQDSGLY